MQLITKVKEFMNKFRQHNDSIDFIWVEIYPDESCAIEAANITGNGSDTIFSFCDLLELEDFIDKWEW